jgi:hypothetical protein
MVRRMALAALLVTLAANTYELLCTAGFPLVFTRILTLHEPSGPAHYAYLALYNLVHVIPLLVIVIAFVGALGARKLGEAEGRALELLWGLMMLGLGLVLLLVPQWLNQPLTALALVTIALTSTLAAGWVRRHWPATGRRQRGTT